MTMVELVLNYPCHDFVVIFNEMRIIIYTRGFACDI